MIRAAYLFTHDLRLNDNQALSSALSASDELKVIYVLDPDWFRPINYQQKPMGINRWQFLKASLIDINEQLNCCGRKLTLLLGNPVYELHQFVKMYQIDELYLSKQLGCYEIEQLERLKALNPKLRIKEFWQSTLFKTTELDFSSVSLNSFTQFKNTTAQLNESITPSEDKSPNLIKSEIKLDTREFEHKIMLFENHLHSTSLSLGRETKFTGGETAGNVHLERYFSTNNASSYKTTRNALDGWGNSTKFSPYLALGNVSAKQIWHTLTSYESHNGANDSTYWIRFELLWREYFQWLLYRFGAAFFKFSGIANKTPLTSYYSQRFKQWCAGCTQYPLVNACMRELNETGYMSNRGRQITASCLVNELGVDWRYGAAYFQQQLIDYDVACNWGNWQYIAGVGVDPRGGRHFDIEKQTAMYDPEGEFINKWTDGGDIISTDHTNIDDWPFERMK